MARILIVDDEPNIRTSVALVLRRQGHEVESVGSAGEATRVVKEEPFDLVMTDVRLREGSGLDLLRTLRAEHAETEVVVFTGFASVEDAVTAMQLGARNYLSKPFDSREVVAAVDAALEHRSLVTELNELRTHGENHDVFDEIVGRARPMQDVLDLVARTAATDSTVLVTGETGTGKELIGRAIHEASRRSDRVFCAVNSAAFPETLLESELFGHQRGAFTGASSNKKGLFEYADRGTIFLDEVGEMPLSMQAKLLRFLQTGEIRPVGSEKTRCVDVRLVTATNKDLEAEVESGRFREDLYYRLAVIPIHLPPLRDRPGDVPPLALHFLERFAAKAEKPVGSIAPDAMDKLCAYAWPGNVRELENCIERGVALCGSTVIESRDLPGRIHEGRTGVEFSAVDSLEVVERIHILNTLEKVDWNRKKAAELLQISTTTLWRRLKEFGIEGHGRPRGVRDAEVATG